MKTLKNVTLGLLLSLGLFQTQANAGVIVGLLSGSATAGVIVGGVTGALGTLAFEALALFDPNPTFGVSLLKGIGVGVILEQKFDSESSLSQIESALALALPMIDDREVIAEIAYATQEKFLLSGETLAKDEKRVIRFSDAEISSFIQSVALSGAQREEVKKILE